MLADLTFQFGSLNFFFNMFGKNFHLWEELLEFGHDWERHFGNLNLWIIKGLFGFEMVTLFGAGELPTYVSTLWRI